MYITALIIALAGIAYYFAPGHWELAAFALAGIVAVVFEAVKRRAKKREPKAGE